jgi:UDP-N-acetylglucosamine--N-acetylmuramyl-(pentapeptide) pyrophosphoryl-undecaprenol N-acetylglucosamine transferase
VDRVAVSFEEVCRYFPGDKVWVSGYPVRSALLEADRAAGYRRLDLDPSLKTLLVLGGSRGARPLNRALMTILRELLARYQIVHVSGQLDWPEVSRGIDQLSEEEQNRYRAYPYLHEELGAAMAIADLVVARAGAATMAEFPAVGLPSVLVPYPYSGQHQGLNADFMVAHGAAVRLDEAHLEARLRPTVMRLLDDGLTLERMGERARALSRPDAARRLAKELHRLAHG